MQLSFLRLSVLGVFLSSTASALSNEAVEHVDNNAANRVTNSIWTPYNVGEGYRGVCGRFIFPSEFGVALSVEDFQPALCNRIVSLRYGDKHVWSQILDVCTNCAKGNINITERLFTHFSSDLSTPLIGEWYLDTESDRV